MIRKVSIKNFKCLRDVQIDLERFTVFVGPNASGKSSVLQAMDLLCRLFRIEHPQNSDGELHQSLSRGTTQQLEVAGETEQNAYRYRMKAPSTPSQVAPTQWDGDVRAIATTLARADWKQWLPTPTKVPPLPLSALLRLEASKLVQPTPFQSDPTVMAPDGSGLHSALANMALHDPDSWQALQVNLRWIIPTIRRLRYTRAAPNQPTALLFDTVGGDSLPARQVSEGTLLVLGLLAVLHASDRPNLVLLDDLDRGLHPKAQRELVSLLRGLLETNPDLQIVATTHSPYLLDRIEAKEVRMTYLEDGSTVCAPLTEHPKFERWKDEFHPGEMWSVFGEDWLVEKEVAR